MNELVFFCFILENKENMFNITIEMLPSMNSLNNEIIESVLEFWCGFSKILFANEEKDNL